MIRRYNAVIAAVLAAFFMAPAQAQNAGSVTNHAFAIGKGAGMTGYTSLLCGSAQLAVGQAAADPICQTITGDVTINASGVTAIGTAKVTSAMMRNSAALSVIGRSANSTGVPGDISCTAASDGVLRESGSVLGCGTIATNGISNNAVTNGKLATMSANTVKGNATGSTAAPTDLAIPSCSTAVSALTWTSGSGFGCNSISGGGSLIYVTPADYGITCDGTTDVSADFQTMVTGSVGTTIFIPPGPSCVIGTSINLPSGTTIIGGGWGSIIESTVVNSATFIATNASDVVLSNFYIQGTNNSSGWGSASMIGAFSVIVNASATQTSDNIQFTKMKVTGFNSTYWISFNLALATTYNLTNVQFTDNYFVSDSSSVPTETDDTLNGNYFVVVYSGSTQSMRASNFSRNQMSGTGMCFGMMFFGNATYLAVNDNQIYSVGQTDSNHCLNGAGTSINAYAISIYDLYSNGNYASNYTISRNIISAPYSSGIYIVGGSASARHNGLIENNTIINQVSNDNATLPRAAIAISQVGDLNIIGNNLSGNFGGIDTVTIDTGEVNVIGNRCFTGNGDPSAHCYRLSPASGSSHTETINYLNNTGTVTSTGPVFILANSSTTDRFGTVVINGNSLKGATVQLNAGGQWFSGFLNVSNNNFAAASGTTNLSSINSLYLAGNAGLSFTAATLPTALNSSSVFVIDGAPGSACTGTSTGSMAFRQNGAWKCF